MSQPDRPDQKRLRQRADLLAVYTRTNGVTAPMFLDESYVCTELPTHITLARTIEQQALIDQAYEG
ncbi:MAG: hypothetical protein ACYC0T_07585 [Ramlibacter sp.]